MRLIFLLLITITFATGCQRPHLEIFPELDDPTLVSQLLTIEQMHQDVDELLAGALARHPDMSNYADLASLELAVKQIKTNITQPLNRKGFFKHIGKLNHHFGDGHSFLIWPYQEWQQEKEQGMKPFPFQVKINHSQQLILAADYRFKKQTLPAGTVITAVNGTDSHQLINHMQQYVGGESRLLREQILAERFAVMIWAVYDFADDFQLALNDQGMQSTLNVDPQQNWQLAGETRNQKEFYYSAINSDTGYLYLNHFDVEPDTFEEFVDQSFEQINHSGVKTLIIDIRDNPGGNTDTVTYLSRHLADKPFRLISSMKEKLNSDNRGLFNYRGNIGDMLSTDWQDWQQPVAAEKRFSGKVYLLISPITYSSAIVLATTLKDNQFATLVGSSTGGYANQTAQGNLFNLPHSQLRAYITTRLLLRPSGDPAREKVTPDYYVENAHHSVQSENDPAIDRVLNLNRQ